MHVEGCPVTVAEWHVSGRGEREQRVLVGGELGQHHVLRHREGLLEGEGVFIIILKTAYIVGDEWRPRAVSSTMSRPTAYFYLQIFVSNKEKPWSASQICGFNPFSKEGEMLRIYRVRKSSHPICGQYSLNADGRCPQGLRALTERICMCSSYWKG